MKTNILLIYTGGTIGMMQDPVSGALKPFNFSHILEEVPELAKFVCNIDTISFDPVIDSSDASPEFWIDLVTLIRDNYDSYDGFVVLHGTDTMAYSASALSFMLENLEKPVVFTGSQLPIGMLRTDGRENLITSIEIAASRDSDGYPCVPEVCIYFENELYRGNRTVKYNAENFRAFRSPNYPVLAEVGIHIRFNRDVIHYPEAWGKPLKINTNLSNDVAVLKLIPGISRHYVESVMSMPGLRALVLETFGSGNAPAAKWFIDAVRECVEKGILVLNVTQCGAGSVDMRAYANGAVLLAAGVTGGADITMEAAVTKLYWLLGESDDNAIVKQRFSECFRGEFSKNN